MYGKLMFAWRTGAQVVIGAMVVWLAARGLNVDPELPRLAEEAIYGAGIAAYAWLVHWLETRTGDSLLSKAARVLAALLMFGAPATLRYERKEPEAVQVLRARS